jgi:hypothetical protein
MISKRYGTCLCFGWSCFPGAKKQTHPGKIGTRTSCENRNAYFLQRETIVQWKRTYFLPAYRQRHVAPAPGKCRGIHISERDAQISCREKALRRRGNT